MTSQRFTRNLLAVYIVVALLVVLALGLPFQEWLLGAGIVAALERGGVYQWMTS